MHNLEEKEGSLAEVLGGNPEVEIDVPPSYSVPNKLPQGTPEERARLAVVRQSLNQPENRGGEAGNSVSPEGDGVFSSKPLDKKPGGFSKPLKKLLALGSMIGFGLGAFQGEAKADDANSNTNTPNSVTAPTYVGGDKNWGPGTNKVDWTKVPGGRTGFNQQNSGGSIGNQIENKNQGQQKVGAVSGTRVAGGTVSPGRTYTADGFSSGQIVVGGDVNVQGVGAFGVVGVEGRYIPGPSGVEVHDYNVSGPGHVDYYRVTKTPGSVSRHPFQAYRQAQAKKDLGKMFGSGKK
jgi:hypothetical protein